MKTTQEDDRQQVALTRFKAVSYIQEQVRNGVILAEALRTAAVCPWPDDAGRCYAARTLEDWYYAYQKDGFAALATQPRSDCGLSKAMDPATGQWFIEQVCQYPKVPVKVIYEHGQQEGKELPPLRTAYRYLKRRGYDQASLRRGRLETGPTKAFEAPHVNDLWMVDFSPGPKLRNDDGVISTQLCVLIDDCSRLIPFAAYYERENTQSFLHTLREAVLRRGVPLKLYTDQGKPFVNLHASVVCANLGIRLLHAKPYHSWSKGKCERVIYTIQTGFESALRLEGKQAHNLDDLNRRLSLWIQTVYHQRTHAAIKCRPESRYQEQLKRVRQLELDQDEVERLFYTRCDRTVRKDGTVRIDNRLYEVDLSLRTLRVQLRFDPFSFKRIEVWHQDRLVGLAKACNLHLNSQIHGGHHAER
jgi:transposase InsO family protein